MGDHCCSVRRAGLRRNCAGPSCRLWTGLSQPLGNQIQTRPFVVNVIKDRALALVVWLRAAPGTPAEMYLIRRGLATPIGSSALRFRPDTPHPEGGQYPALIALIQNVDGIPAAIHRTFLTRDGRKADAVPVKASLGATWGGAIRLQAIEPGKPLAIGEGLESSASAGRLMGLPAWAAISAGNLSRGLLLPEKFAWSLSLRIRKKLDLQPHGKLGRVGMPRVEQFASASPTVQEISTIF